ncbi:hypothetical protein [Herbiconiux sp. A18JL235]|uniref:ABC transporter n=1 Tax=Herbiconiux sp. A18JL235 TaxID=3152363 RepID=A0AB39BEN1_9MICO
MSSDERQDDKPEFPMRDVPAENTEHPDAQPTAGQTPPLPAMPDWQAPGAEPVVDRSSEPVVDRPAEPASEHPVPEPEAEPAGTPADEPLTPEATTRPPLGGPYVVNEEGAPIAEQAVAAYDRHPQGGPYVTSSEPAPREERATPYPAAAYAPTTQTATPTAAPVGELPYSQYQPAPQQTVAPVPPAAKGNRGGGTLIALLGTVAFAALYAAVSFLVISANLAGVAAVTAFAQFLLSAAFIVPVIVFAVSLILIVLVVNRAGWWAYVLGGFLVAVLVYVAGIAGALIHVNAWNLQPQEQYDFVRSLTMDPLTLAGAIVAREVSIWTGAWIASRGRKVKQRNKEAREQFEREQNERVAQPTGTTPSW